MVDIGIVRKLILFHQFNDMNDLQNPVKSSLFMTGPDDALLQIPSVLKVLCCIIR